jgi:hypothetical protein
MTAAFNVCRNAIVLIDSDKLDEEDELKDRVQRVNAEASKMNCLVWVTHGKEVENYIPPSNLAKALSMTCDDYPGANSDIIDYIAAKKDIQKKSVKKVKLAEQVCPHFDLDSLSVHYDLETRIGSVVEAIKMLMAFVNLIQVIMTGITSSLQSAQSIRDRAPGGHS